MSSLALAQHVLVDVLVGSSCALAVIGTWAMLAMRDDYQRLHYLALASMVAPALLALALLVAHPSTQAIKPLATALLLGAASTVLTHATARACRVRAVGSWSGILARVPGADRGVPRLPVPASPPPPPGPGVP